MKRKLFSMMGVSALALTLMVQAGCATTEVRPEGSLVIKIGDMLPPPQSGQPKITDGSYVCSRAAILIVPSLIDMIVGGERITYNNTGYLKPGKSGTKSVAIRINQGKVTEIMAIRQGQGETSRTYATATVFYSIETPVWISSGADFDKVSDFNEAKSMLH